MRFFEFSDAEAQLRLLRKIIDMTWAAIAQQAEDELTLEAQRKSLAKRAKHMANFGKTVKVRTPKQRLLLPKPKIATPQLKPRQRKAVKVPTPKQRSLLPKPKIVTPQPKPIQRKDSLDKIMSVLPTIKPLKPLTNLKIPNPQTKPQPYAKLSKANQNLAQPYNADLSRLNNVSFRTKSKPFDGDPETGA